MYRRMGRACNSINGLKAIMMMVVVQISVAGANLMYKMASINGMSLRVLVAYRLIFAAAFVLPLALYLERKSRPKLTWIVFWQAFFSALWVAIGQNLFAQSLALTSATFASASTNLIPALTFLMGIFFGLERLELDKMAGKAKVLGTLMGIGGGMVLTFYKGVEINIWPVKVDLMHDGQHHSGGHVASSHQQSTRYIMGASLALIYCICSALSLIFQAKMSQRYNCPYSSTALISVAGSVQCIVIAFCIDKDLSQWKLGWNIRLLASAYTGIVASGIIQVIVMWVVRMRGPLFISVFAPLLLVIVAIAESLLLNEKLHLGSVIGAVIIVCGLYIVLWGKSKEIKRNAQLMPSKSSMESEQNSSNILTEKEAEEKEEELDMKA